MRKIWLFDIDGTLVASGGSGQHAALIALAEVFQVPEDAGEVRFAGRTDRAIMWDLFRLHGIETNEENWQQFQTAYLKHLPLTLHQGAGRVLGGVPLLLDRLQTAADQVLGLLTGNVAAGAEAKLRHYGLWDHFAFGGFGDVHLSRDDVANDAYRQACQHLGCTVDPAHIWVVGDTVHDVTCARAIGARVIAVATGTTPAGDLAAAQPDLLLDDLQSHEWLDCL